MKIVSNSTTIPNYFSRTNVNRSSALYFRGISQDSFVSSQKIKIYNPYESCYSSTDIPEDLTKPAEIVFPARKPLILDYNPARFDYLTDKQSGEKIKTMILQSKINSEKVTYHFLSENLKKEYGYVNFIICQNPATCDCKFASLLEDNPREGIIGKRLIVDYLQNFDDERIGGVGKLADKLSVKCCIDNELPFNIVSVADRGSHMAHYLRGKRFYSVNELNDPYRYDFLMENYGKVEINEIFEELAKNIKSHGEKIKPKLGFLEMYMPKQLVMKYLYELKRHPIL